MQALNILDSLDNDFIRHKTRHIIKSEEIRGRQNLSQYFVASVRLLHSVDAQLNRGK